MIYSQTWPLHTRKHVLIAETTLTAPHKGAKNVKWLFTVFAGHFITVQRKLINKSV
eukprot:m.26509 g.26509  ORF g.26509 m.26509 type:complete len:56 (+) comp5862_c0_seq1:1639-1806(+)